MRECLKKWPLFENAHRFRRQNDATHTNYNTYQIAPSYSGYARSDQMHENHTTYTPASPHTPYVYSHVQQMENRNHVHTDSGAMKTHVLA